MLARLLDRPTIQDTWHKRKRAICRCPAAHMGSSGRSRE
ncbi:rCG25365 [Rattus norvegicus]|uniref:RCG25365 n=1 Tax=Rattus norvegicus TaxID=10116 RepID=A6I445_RAT|nr:rCG25365 [Rattus norvegicus]